MRCFLVIANNIILRRKHLKNKDYSSETKTSPDELALIQNKGLKEFPKGPCILTSRKLFGIKESRGLTNCSARRSVNNSGQ